MPELPEVETVKRSLEPHLLNRTIIDLRIGDYERCIATPAAEEFRQRVTGQRITGLGRRGKFILLHLASGDIATIHLRMTGELSIMLPDTPMDKHVHLQFDLDDGRQLRWRDIRKFGRWSLLTRDQYAIFERSIGPEPLEPDLTAERFREMLHRRQRVLKPLLLDQAFIAGIGNIYADEALFRAGIHPRRHSKSLTAEETSRLLAEIRDVLLGSLEHRGTTLRNYRDSDGQPGENLSRLQIYSRKEGDPCPRCGNPVVRDVVGQRGTKLCPTCQPMP